MNNKINIELIFKEFHQLMMKEKNIQLKLTLTLMLLLNQEIKREFQLLENEINEL